MYDCGFSSILPSNRIGRSDWHQVGRWVKISLYNVHQCLRPGFLRPPDFHPCHANSKQPQQLMPDSKRQRWSAPIDHNDSTLLIIRASAAEKTSRKQRLVQRLSDPSYSPTGREIIPQQSAQSQHHIADYSKIRTEGSVAF